jgi:archaellum component FlaC
MDNINNKISNEMKNISNEIKNISNNMEKICNEIERMNNRLEVIENKLNIINSSTANMDNHIQFVENIYDKIKQPLIFAANKITYYMNPSLENTNLSELNN